MASDSGRLDNGTALGVNRPRAASSESHIDSSVFTHSPVRAVRTKRLSFVCACLTKGIKTQESLGCVREAFPVSHSDLRRRAKLVSNSERNTGSRSGSVCRTKREASVDAHSHRSSYRIREEKSLFRCLWWKHEKVVWFFSADREHRVCQL